MNEKQNKRWCCRIFPLVMIAISVVIALFIRYFSNEVGLFHFMNSWRTFSQFAGMVLFVAVLPIGLFYYLNDKEKYEQKAKLLALLGFIPALLYMVFLIL